MQKLRILLLEDDTLLSEILEEFLQTLGYEVTLVYDGESAQQQMLSQKFDLFILDVQVPYLDGFKLLESMRMLHNQTPAIFITSLNTPKDMEKAFAVGGDDYIKKPFDLHELKLRMENIEKHFHLTPSHTTMEIQKNIVYEHANHTLIIDGCKHVIPPKEAMVLHYLVTHPNQVVSLEELGANIYSYEEIPSDSTLRTYIKNIRKLIGEESITTLKGVGYRFNQK
jgi:DNA-binding response OmpR family regulator